eukprot:6175922-Pleurochrysis_carterae.AAC.1
MRKQSTLDVGCSAVTPRGVDYNNFVEKVCCYITAQAVYIVPSIVCYTGVPVRKTRRPPRRMVYGMRYSYRKV